jgi:pimeloyl-ACP methyl ester carboxylesterase
MTTLLFGISQSPQYDTTPLFTRSSTIAETATHWLRRLQDEGVFRKYNEIYFIAHSMGGLLVKRMLVDLNRPGQVEKLRQVKAVLFISTPAQGSNLAELGSFLTVNPQLGDMRVADLNSFLQTVEDQWQDLLRDRNTHLFPRVFCAYETKPTKGTMVVNRVYSATICDENPNPIPEDHSTIVKPISAQADIYIWARARIEATSTLARESPRTPPNNVPAFSDVRLVVGRHTDPVFWVYNSSNTVAQQPKYQLNLWDLNMRDPDPKEARLNLQIPAQVMQDYILPGQALGPWRILGLSGRGSTITPGHVVFGYGQVVCINCQRMRYFWLFLKIGESGWIAEVPEKDVQATFRRLSTVLNGGENAAALVDEVIPSNDREIVP